MDQEQNLKKWKILLVENDEDVRDVVKFQLIEKGYEVIEAQDGRGALKMANAHRPSLILMDIGMPGLDGIQVCRLLKYNVNVSLRRIPIIMLTGKNDEDTVLESVNAGAVDYILKPYSFEDVIRKLEKHLQ